MHGVMEASGSLDTLGVLARSVEDIALYRDVLLGIAPQPIAVIATPPRIGLCRSHVWNEIEPATRKLIENAASALGRAGAAVTDCELPADFSRLNSAHRWISSFEFARTFTYEIENHWDEISDTLRNGRLADGIAGDFDRYMAARELAQECRAHLDELWGDIDVLLTAAAFGEAPIGTAAFAGVPLYQLWTTLHLPAISLPAFKGPNGMPIGAMLLARRHDDRRLFACAQWAWHRLT
jgi:amidase